MVYSNLDQKFVKLSGKLDNTLGKKLRKKFRVVMKEVDKLKDDHRRAKEIGSVLQTLPWVEGVMPIDTNILIFSVEDTASILQSLRNSDVLALPFGPKQIRFVTHLDFTDDDLEKTVAALRAI